VASAFQFFSRFYGIVDSSSPLPPAELVRLMLAAGVRTIQLRLKGMPTRDFLDSARSIGDLCRSSGAIFIVNDRIDIAMLVGADGTHLGQDDLPLNSARRLAGPAHRIGISTHNLEQACEAEARGADYIGFGPIFVGGTKNIQVGQGVAAIREIRAAVAIPIVAIGGITEGTAREVIEAGADAVAIIADVVKAPDIGAKCQSIFRTLDGRP
jgi:thiamine-phosphate pyrophosphorylase